jgi:hypothetical protein
VASLFFYFFFERTAPDSAHFIDIEENTRLQLWEVIGRKQKERKNKDSPGWNGTSTRVPLIGRLD